jgi:hypothetical protein
MNVALDLPTEFLAVRSSGRITCGRLLCCLSPLDSFVRPATSNDRRGYSHGTIWLQIANIATSCFHGVPIDIMVPVASGRKNSLPTFHGAIRVVVQLYFQVCFCHHLRRTISAVDDLRSLNLTCPVFVSTVDCRD